jgi:hypothetical protein
VRPVFYTTIILSAVLYGFETWCLILREECGLRLFENRVRRRIFGPKRDEVTGGIKDHVTRTFMTCTARPILFGGSNEKRVTQADMWHVWGAGEVQAGFWWGGLREQTIWKT